MYKTATVWRERSLDSVIPANSASLPDFGRIATHLQLNNSALMARDEIRRMEYDLLSSVASHYINLGIQLLEPSE